MVAPSIQMIKARPAPCACVAVHTRFTLCRASGNTLPLCVTADHAHGAAVQALAQVKVEPCSAAGAEVPVKARVALRPALCTCVSLWGSSAIKSRRTGSHAHPDLLHPDPLQMHEETRLTRQTAIVIRAGQTATLLAPWTRTGHCFVLPVPGAAVRLTTSVIHAVPDDQNKGDQL